VLKLQTRSAPRKLSTSISYARGAAAAAAAVPASASWAARSLDGDVLARRLVAAVRVLALGSRREDREQRDRIVVGVKHVRDGHLGKVAYLWGRVTSVYGNGLDARRRPTLAYPPSSSARRDVEMRLWMPSIE
jgi:hypothetical protein